MYSSRLCCHHRSNAVIVSSLLSCGSTFSTKATASGHRSVLLVQQPTWTQLVRAGGTKDGLVRWRRNPFLNHIIEESQIVIQSLQQRTMMIQSKTVVPSDRKRYHVHDVKNIKNGTIQHILRITYSSSSSFCSRTTSCSSPASAPTGTIASSSTSPSLLSSEKTTVPGTGELLYQSPFAAVVTKLRVFSLGSSLLGIVGLPVAVWWIQNMGGGAGEQVVDVIDATTAVLAHQNNEPVASSYKGLVAFGMVFSTASMASTAGIQYLFGPYIYSVQRIPIRKCHYKNKDKERNMVAVDDNNLENQKNTLNSTVLSHDKENTTAAGRDQSNDGVPFGQPSVRHQSPSLYSATTRGLFLWRIETVFDRDDVVLYHGFRPFCNLIIKGRPMYLHPEYINNPTLVDDLCLTAVVHQSNEDDEG